jgi:GTP pyrophosphokinase
MDDLLKPLIAGLQEHHPQADVTEVERAFEVARTAHVGQTR